MYALMPGYANKEDDNVTIYHYWNISILIISQRTVWKVNCTWAANSLDIFPESHQWFLPHNSVYRGQQWNCYGLKWFWQRLLQQCCQNKHLSAMKAHTTGLTNTNYVFIWCHFFSLHLNPNIIYSDKQSVYHVVLNIILCNLLFANT